LWNSHQNLAYIHLPMCATCHAHLTLLNFMTLWVTVIFIWPGVQVNEVPQYTVFSIRLSFHPSSVHIFSLAPSYQIPSVMCCVLLCKQRPCRWS
jgi:ABC-type glycerol-3-phosphate transport system permease component